MREKSNDIKIPNFQFKRDLISIKNNDNAFRVILFLLWLIFSCLVNSQVSMGQNKNISNSYVSPSDSLTQPIVLTVSGGISKGSYQAGLNWGLLRFFRLKNLEYQNSFQSNDDITLGDKAKFDIPVYTGASAGNINSIIASIEWCRSDFQDRGPTESLFWDIWTPVGIQQLFPGPEADKNPKALLTRRYFDEVLLDTLRSYASSKKMTEDCRVALGITLTKLEPVDVKLNTEDPITIKSQRSLSVFQSEVSVNTTGDRRLNFSHHPSTLPNISRQDNNYGQLVLPNFGRNDSINDALVFEISKASSAFPIAFAPVELKYLPHRSNYLFENVLETEYFIDGGAFDNNPLDAALNIYKFEKKVREYKSPAKIIYIDPDNSRIDTSRDDDKLSNKLSNNEFGLRSFLDFGFGFISSARQYELETLARNESKLDSFALYQTNKVAPLMGEYLGAFGAFFARPFREYDYYLGIYDALHFVSKRFICTNEDEIRCIPRSILFLVNKFDLPEESKYLIAKVFEYEFGEFSGEIEFLENYGRPWEEIENDKARFMLSIFEANIKVFNSNSNNENIEDLINKLKDHDKNKFIENYINIEVELCKSRREKDPNTDNDFLIDCYFDPFFEDLYSNTSKTILDLNERAAYQLNRVEKEKGDPLFKSITKFSFYGLRYFSLYNEKGWSGGNTVPRYNWQSSSEDEGFWHKLFRWSVPNEIQVDVTSSRVHVGWNPQYRFNSIFALKAPLIPIVGPKKGGPNLFALGFAPSFNTGRFLTIEPRFLYTNAWSEYDRHALGLEAALILGGKLKLGLQNYSLIYGSKWDKFEYAFTIGVVDLPGLLFLLKN